jgi:signal transduction histidine kinase
MAGGLLRRFSLQHHVRLWMGLLIGVVAAGVVLVLWASGAFASARLRLNDIYATPAPASGQVVLVMIDEESLSRYGRTPAEWSRTVYADLTTWLAEAGSRVIAFDVLFAEPTPDDPAFAAALEAARSGETRTRFVMPIVGADLLPEQGTGQLTYRVVQRPLASLAQWVDYLGWVNTYLDADSRIRRQPSLASVNGNEYLSFSLAAYMAYLRIPPSSLDDVMRVTPERLYLTPERSLPIDENGIWLQYYFGEASEKGAATFATASVAGVLSGAYDPAMFADKLVIIGVMNGAGLTDRYFVPLGNIMTGVEIQANAVESLLQGAFPTEQPVFGQVAMIIVLALVASLIYAQLRWYGMLVALPLLILAGLLAAFNHYERTLQMVNLFHGVLALVVPLPLHIGFQITREANRRQKAEFLLDSVTAVERERLAVDNILAQVSGDVRRSVESPAGVAWVIEDEARLAYKWGDERTSFAQLRQQAVCERRLIITYNDIALPFVWQERVLAVITAQRGKRAVPDKLLQSLASQIAPSLDNALLYAQLTRQYALTDAVLAGSPAGIIVLDANFHVKRVNDAAHDIFDSIPTTKRLFTEVLAEAQVEVTECARVLALLKEGNEFVEQLSLGSQTFIMDAAMLSTREWVIVFYDVTALVELNRMKSQMIRIASHDLRNPLALVLNFGELLLMDTGDSEMSPKKRQYIQSMINGGKDMLRIINNILDLEQVRANVVERRPFALSGVINEVVERFAPEASRRMQILTVELNADGAQVLGDQVRIGQAITNLLSNALKYTPEGGCIWIRLRRDTTMLRIEVQDTGYGIALDAQKKLFQEFYRVKTAATREIQGTGLGLSLVKSVIETHGGRVWVQSAEGIGSTFFLELPEYKG